MVEAMYEQSPEYFKPFRENFFKKFLNNEPDVSHLPSNTKFAVHSNHNDFCSLLSCQCAATIPRSYQNYKKCIETVNKITLNLLLCLASFPPLNI